MAQTRELAERWHRSEIATPRSPAPGTALDHVAGDDVQRANPAAQKPSNAERTRGKGQEITMRVSQHKVLITGGSTGIGFALARAFRERSNEVMVCGRRVNKLTEAAVQIPGLHTVQCDVARENDLERLVDAVGEKLGGLSVLVNNAGIQFNDLYGQTKPQTLLEHVDQEIGVNLSGLIKLTALGLPLLSQAAEAAVVNVSSVLALAPKQSAPVYCATKAAVRSFTKALRYQLEDSAPSIKVFEVLPPAVDTEMTRRMRGRKLAPERVAFAVLQGMERDREEIRVGVTSTVALLQRIHPGLAERAIRRR